MLNAADFRLDDQFTDLDLERRVISAVAREPAAVWELDLTPDHFPFEREVWTRLAAAIQKDQPFGVPEWLPSKALRSEAEQLRAMRIQRLVAGLQQKIAGRLYAGDDPMEVLDLVEEEAARARQQVRELLTGQLLWGEGLAEDVLRTAKERIARREETGNPISGVTTGIPMLDSTLNGLGTGLYVLAGPPGAGKTTFSLQMSFTAARDGVPVVYVTYENSPANLVGKAVCGRAGISATDLERGFADMSRLHQAVRELEEPLTRFAAVEGTSKLTVAQVRGKALQAMAKHGADRCLIVFDYLQRAAHGGGYDQIRHNVSALAGELRELSNRLQSPVIAISSQNRSQGGYGAGGGAATPALDSLKESGDLEYSADAVLFLYLNPERDARSVKPARAVDLKVAKNRYGEADVVVPLTFLPDRGVLREAAK